MSLWSLKGKKILLIDDIPGMRSMLKSMIASFGADNISEANNGDDAINLIANNQYDIILCDYNLGDGKDGQQILEEAKEKKYISHSTVYIMTTAENTSEMVMGAVEYLPDEYLSKPFTKQVLIARLKALVDRKSAFKKISRAMQDHDYNTAIDLCDDLIKKVPKNRNEILKIKGEAAISNEQYDLAQDIYQSILDERDLPWARLGLAKVCFYRKDYIKAKEILAELISSNPNYVFAHDLLAKTHQILGEHTDSQKILEVAVNKSPKAILRQKELAKVSFYNEDYDTSENAYKRVLRIGKNSCYRGPEDYLGLAKIHLKKGSSVEALKSISNMKKEYRSSSPDIHIKSLINEASLYYEMNKIDEATKSCKDAYTIFENNPSALLSDEAMVLAKICYAIGLDEEGNKLTQYIVMNNHDNEEVLENLKSILPKSTKDDEFIKLINKTREEVIALNNQGVSLATNGNIEDSIELFKKAAEAMPENEVVNLNTAQSLIMLMNNSGATHDHLNDAFHYLSRVKFDGKPSEKHQKLLSICRKLQSTINK